MKQITISRVTHETFTVEMEDEHTVTTSLIREQLGTGDYREDNSNIRSEEIDILAVVRQCARCGEYTTLTGERVCPDCLAEGDVIEPESTQAHFRYEVVVDVAEGQAPDEALADYIATHDITPGFVLVDPTNEQEASHGRSNDGA